MDFTDEDARDYEALGHIGDLSGGASDYSLIWRIVRNAHVPISDIEDNWTFDMMRSFSAFLQMESDYRSAWQTFYRRKPSE